MSRFIEILLSRPVALIIILCALVISGVTAVADMSVDLLPPMNIPEITVFTRFNGLPAADIREIVTIPLEDALSGFGGLKRIRSYSRDGSSLIQITLVWGTRMETAVMKIRETLNSAYQSLPNDVEKPMILPVNPGEAPVMVLGVFPRKGVNPSFARDMTEREIRTAIQQMEGVGSLQITGGRRDVIEIRPDQFRLNSLGLSVDTLAQAVKVDNIEYPAGSLTEGQFRYTISVDGRREDWTDLSDVYFTGSGKGGTPVKVGDVAEIHRIPDEMDSFLLDGQGEGSALFIRRAGRYSPLSLSRNIRRVLETLNRAYGRDLRVEILHDESGQIAAVLLRFAGAALMGAAAAFIVLLFSLKKIGFALIVLTSIPLSLLGTLFGLRAMGISFNLMSIGGLAIGIGMLVDNSVVVLETLRRKVPSGDWGMISKTVAETAPPILGGVFTSILVFLPLLFIPDLMGELFNNMAWAIILSLTFSVISSLVWVPLLYQRLPDESPSDAPAAKQRFFWRRLLKRTLRNPLPTFTAGGLFILIGFLSLTGFKFRWIIPVRGSRIELTVDYPYGTTVEFMREQAGYLIEKLEKKPGIQTLFITGGGDFSNPYFLADPESRIERMTCVVSLSLSSDWTPQSLSREILKILSGPMNPAVRGFYPMGFVEKILSGNQQRRLLIFSFSQDMMETIPLLKDVRLIPGERRPEIRIIPERKKLSLYGIGLDRLASVLGIGISGRAVSFMEESGRRISVRVRLPEKNRRNREALERMRLMSFAEESIPLRTLASVKNENNYPVLYRENRQDAVLILAETGADQLMRQGKGLIADPLYKDRLTRKRDILTLFMISSGLLYVMLGIQFNSFVLPLLFLFLQPLAIAGSLLLLSISRRALDLNSMLGMFVVLGQSINNAILLYDTCSLRIRKGFSPGAAVYTGTAERMKSIMISGTTTAAALLPLALDFSGRNPQQTLSIAILGGAAAAIPSTLFLFPSVISVYASNRRKFFSS